MQTIVFNLVDGHVDSQVSEAPLWSEPDEFGQVAADLHRSPNSTTVQYRIPVGCTVPIHASANYAICQIMSGRGKLILPSGKEFEY